jgi:hypothetical protein
MSPPVQQPIQTCQLDAARQALPALAQVGWQRLIQASPLPCRRAGELGEVLTEAGPLEQLQGVVPHINAAIRPAQWPIPPGGS